MLCQGDAQSVKPNSVIQYLQPAVTVEEIKGCITMCVDCNNLRGFGI
jgi:hypothetical protein